MQVNQQEMMAAFQNDDEAVKIIEEVTEVEAKHNLFKELVWTTLNGITMIPESSEIDALATDLYALAERMTKARREETDDLWEALKLKAKTLKLKSDKVKKWNDYFEDPEGAPEA